jgi:hypothetical protein
LRNSFEQQNKQFWLETIEMFIGSNKRKKNGNNDKRLARYATFSFRIVYTYYQREGYIDNTHRIQWRSFFLPLCFEFTVQIFAEKIATNGDSEFPIIPRPRRQQRQVTFF